MVQNKKNQVLLQSSTDKISFNNIDINYVLKKKKVIRNWVNLVLTKENKTLGEIDYNFCTDKHLLKVNKQYLNHNTYTDIITFDLSDSDLVFADIYISVERVKENSLQLKNLFSDELLRVMVHGVLHLCGYKDKTPKDILQMRKKENHYLSLLK